MVMDMGSTGIMVMIVTMGIVMVVIVVLVTVLVMMDVVPVMVGMVFVVVMAEHWRGSVAGASYRRPTSSHYNGNEP